MAELWKIDSEVYQFKTELFYRYSEADESRLKENQAATRIQSWFRACRVRAYLSHLRKKAIIIQKIWRGFTARARFRQMVKEAYFIMKMNFYEEMAVRIQRRWRGFFVRKHVHNFYARKRYLEGVTSSNDFARREQDELEEVQRSRRQCLQVLEEQTAKVYQAYRSHHLLSTKQCPGIFNSPFRPEPHEMEQLLRQVKYQPPTRLAPGDRTCVTGNPGPPAFSFPGTLKSPWTKTYRSCCSSRSILPPIASHKQQGPFREPGEVWVQRLNCPDLRLRLQTSYTHLEETQNQLRQHESLKLSRAIRTESVLHHEGLSFTQPAFANKFIA